MTSDGEKSIWQIEIPYPKYENLQGDLEVDVCIVGAGIAGLTTAYLLACENKSVAVIDARQVGCGETGKSTAHLTNAFDDRYYRVEEVHGEKVSKVVADSHTQAIDLIEKIIKDESLNCEFERLDGYLFTESNEILDRELESAKKAGLNDIEKLSSLPLTLCKQPCLRFANQAQINPLKYIIQLAQVATKKGVRIFDNALVQKVQGGSDRHVLTDRGIKIKSNHIVVATNTPINDLVVIHDKQSSNRSYVIGALITKGSVPKALYWDNEDPYHYVRLQNGSDFSDEYKDYDILIVGGEDHKCGTEHDGEERYKRLEHFARKNFASIHSVPFHWSGHIQEPIDYLGYLGRNPLDDENIYVCTGDSGNGMTHGTIAALIFRDLICKKENPWVTTYDPSRKSFQPSSIKKFAMNNMENLATYSEYFTKGDVEKEDDIKPGCGAILRDGINKVATYKDNDGKVHKCSAICPHLQCLVNWNPTEKSWDCPCHGSRFDAYGKVLNGPACKNLEPMKK
ncbi:MAG: FAD-dependent oxidoreductase [Parachlamydiales bacterium]|nr:FAD-dependent oxidoreductase [Parachlamydiales bacterium]